MRLRLGSAPRTRAPGGLRALTAVVLALALAGPGAAAAQAPTPPSPVVSLVASVVSAVGLAGPTPTGSVTFTVDLKVVATIPLLGGVAQLSTAALGLGSHTVVAAYSGDSTHAPGVSVVSVPSAAGDIQLTIAVNPVATSAPVVSIVRPADGAHYAQGSSVIALYTCTDPGGTSPVARCDGPVPSGSPIDTAAAGAHAFTVTAANAAGQESSGSTTYVVDPAAPAAVHAQSGSGHKPSVAVAQIPAPVVTPRTVLVAPRAAVIAGPRVRVPRPAGRKPVRRPPAPPAVPRPARVAGGLRPYDPRSEPAKVVGLEVTAFTLLALVGAGGAAAAGTASAGSSSGGGSGASFDVDYEGVDVAYLAAAAGVAIGDRSRTWRLPGTAAVDAASVALPERLAARSPLLARIAADGAYLRSILGSAAVLPAIAGVAMGAVAVGQTGGRALPPVTGLAIAIAVLGVMDAAAGFLAVITFAVGVVVLGGLDSAAAVRTMLGLCALWFVVPVLAGAARPLRRPDPPRTAKERFDRAADFVIVSLIGAWVVQKIAIALPGLAGYQLPIARHANEAALWVLAALVVRMLGETAAAHLYPKRLVTVHHRDLREPAPVQRLLAAALRTAIFVFIAAVVVGQTWQLWVAGLLFLVPQAMAVYEERFPKSGSLGRVLLDGLLEMVFMIFLLTGLGALLLAGNSKSLLADSFVLLAIPGAVLSILHAFGGAGDDRSRGWGRRIAGIVLLTAAALQVQGLLL